MRERERWRSAQDDEGDDVGDKTNKMLRCQGTLPPCLIQLVSKTKRIGERERSVGQKWYIDRKKHVKQEREREAVLETVG